MSDDASRSATSAGTEPARTPGSTAWALPGTAGRARVVVGAVSVLVGLLVVLLPNRTLLLVGVLVGVQLVLVGLVRAWAVRAFALTSGARALGYAFAAATVVAGVVCMLRPGTSLLVLAIFIGVGWVADGVVELVAFARGAAADRGYSLFNALVLVAGGVVVVAFPRSSLVTLAQVTGVLLIVLGVVHLVSGLAARRTSGNVMGGGRAGDLSP